MFKENFFIPRVAKRQLFFSKPLKLFDKIKITTSVDAPRKFDDYDIGIEKISIEGVELTKKVENKTLGD